MYALTDGVTSTRLVPGKNVIGRSAVPVEGVAFISLESPRAAISRMQAFIEVAPNGDAWLADCNSTNGTFLATRDGTGVRLEPNHYYQLSPGCRIVFGDVERVFVSDPDLCPAAQHDAVNVSTVTVKACTPYLDQSDVAQASRRNSTVAPAKRQRSHDGSVDVPAIDAPRKEPRTRSTTLVSSSVDRAVPIVACFTGMDSDEKSEAKKAIKRLGGRVVEDIQKASLLIVKEPSTRTPKFLIAVGRAIPIVTEKILEAEAITADTMKQHAASLYHDNNHHYTSAALQQAIYRAEHVPILHGLTYNLAELPAKLRSSAQEVILGCGGEVKKTKKDATVLSQVSLNGLYDSILRAKRPV